VNKRLIKTLPFVLGCLILTLIIPTPSLAQSGDLNLVTSPLPLSLITEPGSTVSAQLKIKNGGAATETLQMGLMKFSAYGDEGKPRLMDRDKGDDYFDWVKFSEDSFDLAPNEWKTITMDITVPKTATFGYYYAVTFARKNDEIPSGPRSNKVIGATASLVLLEVRVPNAIRDVEVVDFSTPQKFYEFLPVRFNIKLKNKGNVHVAPRGNIFIDGFGKKNLGVLSINDNKGNLLPDSNRVFEADWNDGFPVYQQQADGNVALTDSHGKEVKNLKWDLTQVTKLRWGKFTANMLLVYDDGQRDIPIEGKLEFYVIPWRILGVGSIVLLLVLIGLFSVIKPVLRKVFKKKKESDKS
jgi:hypothetical protein